MVCVARVLRRVRICFVFAVPCFLWVVSAGEPGEESSAEEEISMMAVGIAATLIGAVSFQMGLFYLTNHSDDDMRRYTYEILNATISIFAAVMLFQTCDDLIDTYVLEGMPHWKKSIAHMLHMLAWYTFLQLSLAWISGAIGSEPKSMESMELNMKSFAVLLAHLTGFASINAWGFLQQLPSIRTSPLLVACILPVSFAGQFLLQRLTGKIRTCIALGDDGEEDEWEKAWSEETAEAENDVMGLTLSFNITQTFRFFIFGVLPDRHGNVEEDVVNIRGDIWLVCIGLAAAFLMVLLFLLDPRYDKKETDAAENINMPEQEGNNTEEDQGEGNEEESVTARLRAAAILTFGMTFAWCLFFSSRSAMKDTMHGEMVVAVCLALAISLVSFGCIRLLDLLADADWTGDRTDDAIAQMIRAIGILVGFGWEQCFDVAVESLSEATPPRAQHTVKMILGLFCVFIITPAWKWYLLPMSIHDGWKFGFVVNTMERLKETAAHFDDVQKALISRGRLKEETAANLSIQAKILSVSQEDANKQVLAENRKRQLTMLREEGARLKSDLQVVKPSCQSESDAAPVAPTLSQQKYIYESATVTKPPSPPVKTLPSKGQQVVAPSTQNRKGVRDVRRLNEKVDRLEELTQSLLRSIAPNR